MCRRRRSIQADIISVLRPDSTLENIAQIAQIAVYDCSDSTLEIALYDFSDSSLKNIDQNKQQGEFAYAIDYRYGGQGLITYAVNSLIPIYTTFLNLQSFRIIANKDNPASIRVAEKCGFKWTKTLEKEFEPPGKPAKDMELYELSI